MAKVPSLRNERAKVATALFLCRCCCAWLPIGLLYLYEQKPIGFSAFTLYVIGIPAFLAIYDRFILKK